MGPRFSWSSCLSPCQPAPWACCSPSSDPQNVLWVRIWVTPPAPSSPFPSERSSHQLSPADSQVVWASSWGFPAARPTWGLQAHLLWGVLAAPSPPPLDEGLVADRGSSTGRRGGVGPCVAHCRVGDRRPAPPPLAWPDAGPPQPAAARGAGPLWGRPPALPL